MNVCLRCKCDGHQDTPSDDASSHGERVDLPLVVDIDIKNERSHGTNTDVLTLFEPDPDPDPHKAPVAQDTTMGIEQTKVANNSLEHDGYSMLLKSSSCFIESSDDAHAAKFADVPSYGEHLHPP